MALRSLALPPAHTAHLMLPANRVDVDVVNAGKHHVNVPADHPVQPVQYTGVKRGDGPVCRLLSRKCRAILSVKIEADAFIVHKRDFLHLRPASEHRGNHIQDRRLEPHGIFQCPVKHLLLIQVPLLEDIPEGHGGQDVLGAALADLLVLEQALHQVEHKILQGHCGSLHP